MREMRLGDIYPPLEYRYCAVMYCPKFIRSPRYLCDKHAKMFLNLLQDEPTFVSPSVVIDFT